MERTRYFRSANQLNITVNVMSGNVFPLGDEHTPLNFISLLWILLMWFTKVTFFLTGLIGSLYFANLTSEELFKRSAAVGMLCVEMTIPTVYLNIRRKDFRKLIRDYNGVLIDSDNLRRCVYDTVRPYRKGLQYYMIACFSASCVWAAAPIFQIIDNDKFTYANFTLPAYYPGEPFGSNLFAMFVVFQAFGCCSIQLGKISVDLYVIHFIAVLSAQYKYVGEQICEGLKDNDDEKDELSIIIALHNCVRHHSAVIKIGRRLGQLLALHIGATYITCILKFCFLAFGLITFGSADVEKVAYLMYVSACIVQVFLLCSSIEELLTELKNYISRVKSTSVTEGAFHENWYGRSIVVKKIFRTIGVTNQMECRLSAYHVVELVVPTLALIISKSYSVCLLLLKVN